MLCVSKYAILLRFEILLNTDLKIILLGHQNNFVNLKNKEQYCKKFILAVLERST